MSPSFHNDAVPLVERYHALSTQRALATSEVKEFATKLEHIFSSIPLPARRSVPWGYTPDSADSKENTLGNSGINPFPPDALHKPTSEQEIIDIVKKAYEARTQVRVIGAAHSSPSNIILDAPQGVFPKNVVLISLTKYRGVSINKDKKLATVKAGTNIDVDPEEADSTKENGLAFQLQQADFALPDLGGVTHQTIGGFLSTGSAGGSLLYGFDDALYSFTLIDGTGTKHVLSRDDRDPTLFYATGVSVGLCGIITEATFSLTPTFNVAGTQQSSPVQPLNADWNKGCPVNLFGPAAGGVPGIVDYFKDPANEYMRMLYWPQPDLPPRVQIWTGKRVPAGGPIKKYDELSVLMQIGAKTALWLLWQLNYFRDTPIIGAIEKEIAAKILNIFIPLGVSVTFSDIWSNIIPMDNGIQDTLLPSAFAEFWFDVDKAADAVNTLRALNESDSGTIGNFFTEFYSAKRSPFWLSPSYTGDKFRIDVTFFQYDTELGSVTKRSDPADFFRPYFEYFDKHGPEYRCHLGKYVTPDFGNLKRLRSSYPKYDEWIQIRAKLDPRQVFATPYWREHFLIPPAF